jgi:hypothetical protein
MKTTLAKIKMCIWWNFGVPEIRNIFALVTRHINGEYTIESCTSGGYMKDEHARFAVKERFFYTD